MDEIRVDRPLAPGLEQSPLNPSLRRTVTAYYTRSQMHTYWVQRRQDAGARPELWPATLLPSYSSSIIALVQVDGSLRSGFRGVEERIGMKNCFFSYLR